MPIMWLIQTSRTFPTEEHAARLVGIQYLHSAQQLPAMSIVISACGCILACNNQLSPAYAMMGTFFISTRVTGEWY